MAYSSFALVCAFGATLITYRLDAQAPTEAHAATDKLVCRSEDTLGSRLGSHKTCLTKAQWAERNRRESDSMDRRLRAGHDDTPLTVYSGPGGYQQTPGG